MGISDQIIKQIQKALNEGISKDNLEKTGKEVAESIKKRTRLGRSVEKTGNQATKLEPLSAKYKKQRSGLKKKGKLSSQTTPAKSNLTKSGEMVDNIKSKANQNGFEIYIEGRENREKARYVQEKRPFMNLAKFEIKLIIENIINRIRRTK